MFQTGVLEKIKAHILGFSNLFFLNRAVYEIMWKNTQSEYVILISVPLQQRLHERASMLRYSYIACLVVL